LGSSHSLCISNGRRDSEQSLLTVISWLSIPGRHFPVVTYDCPNIGHIFLDATKSEILGTYLSMLVMWYNVFESLSAKSENGTNFTVIGGRLGDGAAIVTTATNLR
jgi:hypothetical protein